MTTRESAAEMNLTSAPDGRVLDGYAKSRQCFCCIFKRVRQQMFALGVVSCSIQLLR